MRNCYVYIKGSSFQGAETLDVSGAIKAFDIV